MNGVSMEAEARTAQSGIPHGQRERERSGNLTARSQMGTAQEALAWMIWDRWEVRCAYDLHLQLLRAYPCARVAWKDGVVEWCKLEVWV